MRKWLPAILIGLSFAASAATFGQLAPRVRVPVELLLPPGMGGGAEMIPRLVAAFGLPILALAVWALLFEAPVGPLGRLGMRLFPGSAPARYEVFASTYRLIVIWVVCLPLSLQLVLLGSALEWPIGGGRAVGMTLGGGLILVGNLFPRLRRNPIAGIRTARTMSDPRLWARVHRAFGALWLVAGALTALVAIAAPRYALAAGIVTLALSMLGGLFIMRTMAVSVAALLLIAGIPFACSSPTGSDPPRDTDELARRLDTLRRAHGIPGMAAAVGCDGAVLWSSGFGSADVAGGVPATPHTVFHVASITKTFASIVLLQLVDEGRISLDDPVADYGVQLEGDVRVRHLLSHTSDPLPGSRFRYDGNRYALLDSVVQRADGQPFASAVLQRVIAPAGLTRTAPSSLVGDGIDGAAIRAALAQGYDGGGRPIAYPAHVNVAAGLLSTVLDLIAYATAIERDRLYPDAVRALAFTPMRATSGAELPYGLGWFVEHRTAGEVVWHFGSWTGNSALLVLAPDRGASFALLANSDRLSTPFPLEEGRLESSAFARAFLGWLEQGEGCGGSGENDA